MKDRTAITVDQLSDANLMHKYLNHAIESWQCYNNGGGFIDDESSKWYNKLEKIAQKWADVKLDCGVGLYPTFEVEYNGKHYTIYSISDFFKLINGFWD
jgi:hypothetical protein